MKFTKEEKKNIFTRVIILISAITFYYLLFRFEGITDYFNKLLGYSRPIIIGFVIAFVVNMLTIQYEKLFKKVFKMKEGKALKVLTIIFGYLTLILLAAFLISVVVPQFISSLITLANQLPGLVQNTISKIQQIPWFDDAAIQIEKFVNKIEINNLIASILNWIRGQGSSWLSGTVYAVGTVFSGFFEAFLGFSISVYVISTKDKLGRNSKELTYAIFPEKFADKLIYVTRLLYTNFYNFFTGQFLEAIILGTTVFIGVKIIGSPYDLMLGVTTALFNLIPYFGSLLAGLLGFTLIAMSNFTKGIIFLVYIIIAQQIDGNIMYPRLVGSKMGIPPFWMMIAITLGGAMMGIIGMIIFVPIFSTLYTLARDFSKKRLVKKNINIEEK